MAVHHIVHPHSFKIHPSPIKYQQLAWAALPACCLWPVSDKWTTWILATLPVSFGPHAPRERTNHIHAKERENVANNIKEQAGLNVFSTCQKNLSSFYIYNISRHFFVAWYCKVLPAMSYLQWCSPAAHLSMKCMSKKGLVIWQTQGKKFKFCPILIQGLIVRDILLKPHMLHKQKSNDPGLINAKGKKGGTVGFFWAARFQV